MDIPLIVDDLRPRSPADEVVLCGSGFRWGPKGTHTSRTIMLDELRSVLAYCRPEATRDEYLAAICEDSFGATPEAWVLGIRGYSFEFVEGLTSHAQKNLEDAVAFVEKLIASWKEQAMDSKKKTILTIDDDPDVRAALRVVLEANGFAVGEASTGEEGLKIVERIQPDVVIIDLMMENVDSGSTMAQKLKESNYEGLVYMLSSAGDTVRYNIDARELGLAGIFQKPIDPKTLVTTLRAKLGAD